MIVYEDAAIDRLPAASIEGVPVEGALLETFRGTEAPGRSHEEAPRTQLLDRVLE